MQLFPINSVIIGSILIKGCPVLMHSLTFPEAVPQEVSTLPTIYASLWALSKIIFSKFFIQSFYLYKFSFFVAAQNLVRNYTCLPAKPLMLPTHTMYELKARVLQVKYGFCSRFWGPTFCSFCRAEKFKYNSLGGEQWGRGRNAKHV